MRPALAGQTTLEANHFSYALAAGTRVADSIIVSNFTAAPMSFHVYGADAITAQGGGLAPVPEGSPARLVGTWITVETPVLTVPAGQEVHDGFTVTVPAGTQPGDHLGALVAARQPPGGAGIQVATRAALITRVTVPGAVNLGVSLGALEGSSQAGDEVFTLPVANTGNVLFTFSGEVAVRDHGATVATLPLTPADIYVIPGGTATVRATWRGPPAWGEVDAVATIHVSLNGAPSGTFTSSALHLSFFPWRLLLAVVASVLAMLLLVAGALLLLHRRSTGACTHCRVAQRRRRLVEVTEMADVSECRRCLRTLHDAGRATLCKRCLTQHLVRGAAAAERARQHGLTGGAAAR